MFDFVKCATDEPVLFNIESKVDGDFRNLTRSPEDFVAAMGAIFVAQGEDVVDRITHQSFDVSVHCLPAEGWTITDRQWRTLIISKRDFPSLRTSALCDDTTLYKPLSEGQDGNLTTHGVGASNWLAGIDIDSFEGETVGERVARAAHSIKADFLSPVATSVSACGLFLQPPTHSSTLRPSPIPPWRAGLRSPTRPWSTLLTRWDFRSSLGLLSMLTDLRGEQGVGS
jgi:hypothetical protein